MKVYNMLNVHECPKNYWTSDLASETIPDMSMDIREILHRYVYGNELPKSNELSYMDEIDIEHSSGININKLDLSERMDILKQTNERLKTVKSQNESLNRQNEVQQNIPLSNEQQNISESSKVE